MKTLAVFGVIALAMLSAIYIYPSVRSSGERPATANLTSHPEQSNTPMMPLEITDYSLEFRQPTSSERE